MEEKHERGESMKERRRVPFYGNRNRKEYIERNYRRKWTYWLRGLSIVLSNWGNTDGGSDCAHFQKIVAFVCFHQKVEDVFFYVA